VYHLVNQHIGNDFSRIQKPPFKFPKNNFDKIVYDAFELWYPKELTQLSAMEPGNLLFDCGTLPTTDIFYMYITFDLI